MTIWVIDILLIISYVLNFGFTWALYYQEELIILCKNKLDSFAKAFKLTIKNEADDPNKVIPGGRILTNIPYFSKLKRKTSSCGR